MNDVSTAETGPKIEIQPKINFTPLPEKHNQTNVSSTESARQTAPEPLGEENNSKQIDEMLANILRQSKADSHQETIPEIEDNVPEMTKYQTPIARLLEWIKTSIKNFWINLTR